MSDPFDKGAFDKGAPADDGVANLAAAIRRRFEPLGGVELEPLPRAPLHEPPSVGTIDTPTPRLLLFEQLVQGPSLHAGFELLTGAPSMPRSVLYFLDASVGEYVFCALIRRPIVEHSITGSKWNLVCGSPERIESYALANDGGESRQLIWRDYERHYSDLSNRHPTLGLGDVGALFPSPNRPGGSEISALDTPSA